MKKSIGCLLYGSFILLAFPAGVHSQSGPRGTDYPRAVLSIDPVGFITLGPSINAEVALGKAAGLSGGLRFPNLGVVTKAIYPDMEMSTLFRAGIRFYTSPVQNLQGFCIGPGIEFGQTNYENSSYQVVAPGLELGYKWIWINGLSLELGDSIGIVYSKRDDSQNPAKEWQVDMIVFYLLSVRLGVAL